MYLRKFYSPDDDFSGGTFGENIKVIDPSKAPEQTQETETVTQEPASPATIADQTAEAAKPAEVTPEVTQTEQPEPTAPPATEPAPVTPPVVQKNWEEQLKEEGLESVISMAKYYKEHGDLKPYLSAISVDYKEMPPEEIMRRDLREQYPSLSQANFEKLFSREVTQKYKLDPEAFDEEDVALGKEMLAHEADKLRTKFIEKQTAFTIPTKDFAGEQQKLIEEQNRQAAEQQEQFKQSVFNNPTVKSLTTSKALSLDAGDGIKFNYGIDNPNEVLDLLLKPEKYGEAMSTKDASGNMVPDLDKITLTAAFAKDPKAFMKALVDHGENRGKQKLVNTLENPGAGGVTTNPTEMTFAEAMIKNGVRKGF